MMATRREGVNIGFKHLTYKVKTGIIKKSKSQKKLKIFIDWVLSYLTGEKKVLDDISGAFRTGELSAIIGPSGSGKTTFLNILSGLVQDNYKGTLTIDESDYKIIRNQSAYIMHDQMLYPLLSVREAMSFAIRFKTGTTMTLVQQKCKCDAILKQLNFLDSADTMTKNLSGGQRKRLSIALELVSDPTILFLDEITTGLDSLSSSQFVAFLSNLAQSGKTIICSVHAPSALMFEAFDHVYAIAEGKCIYQGSTTNIVPFLAELNLSCPAFYNPADFLLEVATCQYGNLNQTLSEKIGNGQNESYRNEMTRENRSEYTTDAKHLKYKTTFADQLLLLIERNLLFMRRNKDYVFIRLVICVAVAVMVGIVFYDFGHLANRIFDNYKFIFSTTQFLMYSSFFSLLTRCKHREPK